MGVSEENIRMDREEHGRGGRGNCLLCKWRHYWGRTFNGAPLITGYGTANVENNFIIRRKYVVSFCWITRLQRTVYWLMYDLNFIYVVYFVSYWGTCTLVAPRHRCADSCQLNLSCQNSDTNIRKAK